MQPRRNVEGMPDRTPPQAVEVEEVILGSILLDPNAIERVEGILKPEMFYLTDHRRIYKAMLSLRWEELPTDLIHVSRRLDDLGELEQIGSNRRLAALLDATVSAVNVDQYANLIRDKFKRRELIRICQEIGRDAYDNSMPLKGLLEAAEQKVFSMTDSASQTGLKSLADIVIEEAGRIERLSNGEKGDGYPTGFYDLDAMTKGLKPHQLVIVAGRPAMGKSCFASAIARNIAAQGKAVALFSLEMSGGEIGRRLLSAEAQIDSLRLEVGTVDAADWEPIGHAVTRLASLPLFVDESQSVTPSHIASQCRKLRSEQGSLGLVVIDYLHLMLDGGDDEVREIGRITRACKKLARELNAPVLLLSQLSRAVETQADKRPSLKDLRSSGSIEQDADLVLLLYRDEYYNPGTADRGIAEIIVAKQRSGPTGTVKLLFEPQFTRFRNLRRSSFG